MTQQQLDQALSHIALYEQAKAHLIKQGLPVTEFIKTRLEEMYLEIANPIRKFVSKEMGAIN